MRDAILKGRYVTTRAFGLLDLGTERPSTNKARYAVVLLDTDKNGIIDTAEANAVRANLYSLALAGVGQPLTDANGQAISINSCVDSGKELNPDYRDDSIKIFNRDEEIMLMTNYTDRFGNEYITTEAGLSDLDFSAILFLVNSELIA